MQDDGRICCATTDQITWSGVQEPVPRRRSRTRWTGLYVFTAKSTKRIQAGSTRDGRLCTTSYASRISSRLYCLLLSTSPFRGIAWYCLGGTCTSVLHTFECTHHYIPIDCPGKRIGITSRRHKQHTEETRHPSPAKVARVLRMFSGQPKGQMQRSLRPKLRSVGTTRPLRGTSSVQA